MRSLARATAVMSVGTILSRITGLLRLVAIVAALGVAESRLPDTYNLANTAPNIIYELVLGGILTSVFVPVFVELLEKEGRDRAWQIVSAIINISMVVLIVITIVGIVAAPLIAKFYAVRCAGCAGRQQEVLTFLLRLFIPQIIFYGLTAMSAGLLNAHKRFGAPMYTPVLNNLAVIALFVAFHQAVPMITLESVTTAQLWVIGAGTTAGVVLMALAQLPFLRGLGTYRMSFDIKHPAIKKLAGLSVFVIGYVITNQIGYLIVQWLANKQQGGYSAYVSAFIFFLLPQGLFAVSIFTALLPGMSEHAVNQRWAEYRDRLATGVTATVFLVLPAAIGYFVLGEQLVKFLLERGVMTARSTELVAAVLRFFVIGLVPFSLYQLFLRAFYALQDTRTPFLINCFTTLVNIVVNVAAFAALGVEGLALGHAASYLVGIFVQGIVLSKRIGGLELRLILGKTLRMAVAGAAMGALVWVATAALGNFLDASVGGQAVGLGVPVLIGMAAYLAFAYVLKIEEVGQIRSLISNRGSGGAA